MLDVGAFEEMSEKSGLRKFCFSDWLSIAVPELESDGSDPIDTEGGFGGIFIPRTLQPFRKTNSRTQLFAGL